MNIATIVNMPAFTNTADTVNTTNDKVVCLNVDISQPWTRECECLACLNFSCVVQFEEGECEPETVVVLGVVFSVRYMTGVDVKFTGRVLHSFHNVEGYLFEGTDGTSDFLLRNQKPLSLAQAKQWMSHNGETKRYNTKVLVTPTSL